MTQRSKNHSAAVRSEMKALGIGPNKTGLAMALGVGFLIFDVLTAVVALAAY